jgi:hypothetical protein
MEEMLKIKENCHTIVCGLIGNLGLGLIVFHSIFQLELGSAVGEEPSLKSSHSEMSKQR